MPRELTFRLSITTELGDGDEARPTIEYVTDWLTNQGYDSQVLAGMIERSHRWYGGITKIENAGQDNPEWSVACYDCDWTLAAPQSAAVCTANQHTEQHNVKDPDVNEYGVLTWSGGIDATT